MESRSETARARPVRRAAAGAELVGIGEAARRLGMNTSALRYYEERGIVRPAARQGGRRLYGPEELRRLAFVQIMQALGLRLDAAAAMLDEPGEHWRTVVREQVAALDALVARARAAQDFLRHALGCPTSNPSRDCGVMIEALDRRLTGVSVEQLAAEHGHPVPPGPPPTGRAPAPPERGGIRSRSG